MSFSDGKILINNEPADDKGKPNTLTREVAGDKLTQVKNGPGFSILWRLHVKKLVFYIVMWFLSFYNIFCLTVNITVSWSSASDFASSTPFDYESVLRCPMPSHESLIYGSEEII